VSGQGAQGGEESGEDAEERGGDFGGG